MNDQLQTDLASLEEARQRELDLIQDLRDAYDLRDSLPGSEIIRGGYPRFRKGTKVQVRPELREEPTVYDDGSTGPRKVPWWATSGIVVANPPPGNDYHGFPYILWDSDGKKRHIPETWLENARRDRNYLRAACGCGRFIRVSDTTLEQAAIVCGACNQEFQIR